MWTRLRARLLRLSFLLERRRLDRETRQEIDAHLDLLAQRYRHQGLSADEAYIAARRQFGNVTLLREDVDRMNSISWVGSLAQDLRDARRHLRASAGFAAVVAATLGLGIGGATAVFSVVQGVLLAPLPYEEPGRLVRFYQQEPGKADTRYYLTGVHFRFLRDQAVSFEDVAVLANYSETGLDLVAGGRGHRLRVLRVSSGYFETLRAQPRPGRGFDRDDETGTRRVVLSDSVWRSHFAGDTAVVGTTIRLSAEPYEVAGIAPPGFKDPIAPDVEAWLPYDLAGDTFQENYGLTAVGRLRHGVTLEQAQSELTTLDPRMRQLWPGARRSAIVTTPLQEELVARAQGPIHLVFGSVVIVLLVACVNVANLALVRASGRVHEFAVRAALGSSRIRLARQLLIESLLIACLGGAAGLALAGASIHVLRDLGRDAVPRLDTVGLNLSVLIFALASTLVTAVVSGVAPVFMLARTAPADALRQQSRSATGSRGLARLRGALATAQLALAVTLVAGAAVLVASFVRLQRVDLGFRADRVLTFEVNLPTAGYDAARRASVREELASRFETIPGVVAAGGISRLPATGSYHPWNARIRTGPLAGTMIDKSRFVLQNRVVSGNAFAALGIPTLAGRAFDALDHAGAPGRTVVSANFARVAFPGVPYEAVVGQRIYVLVGARELEIIGVVGDVALDVYGAPTMVVYHAHRQFAANRNWALTQVVATEQSPEQVLSAAREVVARLDPELVVYRPATMAEVVGRGTSRERFALVLMGAFALVTLALAALGLYGVLAYSVRQRSTEMGVRIALGATAGQVRALVFRQAAAVAGVGVVAGLAGALVLGRWLDTLTFGIAPSDPRVLVASAGVLTLVAFIAAWLPAQRASRVQPRVAMESQ
jgi:predicted permease